MLLTQADLGDGNDIAALSGQVAVLTQAYDPDTDLMTLPASFTLPDTNRPLFVRLWQAAVPFTVGHRGGARCGLGSQRDDHDDGDADAHRGEAGLVLRGAPLDADARLSAALSGGAAAAGGSAAVAVRSRGDSKRRRIPAARRLPQPCRSDEMRLLRRHHGAGRGGGGGRAAGRTRRPRRQRRARPAVAASRHLHACGAAHARPRSTHGCRSKAAATA